MKTLLVTLLGVLVMVASGACLDLDSLLLVSVGGPAGLKTVQGMTSFRAAGDLTLNGQRGRFVELVVPPNKIHLSLTFPQFGMIQAFDGQEGWQSDINGRISPLSGFEQAELLKSVYFETYSYLVPGRVPGKSAYIRDTVLEGETYHVVEFYPYLQDTVRVLYEAGSGGRSLQLTRMDNIPIITALSDIAHVEGVPIAMSQVSLVVGVPMSIEMAIDSAAFNVLYDERIFARPGTEHRAFPGGAPYVEIPFEYRGGHVWVQATINGKKRVVLILDSGASATIFDSSVVADLHLEEVGKMPARGVAGFMETQLVRADSVSVGGITLVGQIGGMGDLSALGQSAVEDVPFGGIIGYDFLSQFPIMIDPERSLLVVYNPASFQPPTEGYAIPFELTMQVPTVRAEVGEVSGNFLVDLGNAFGLILHEEFAHQQGLDTLPPARENNGRVGGIGGGIDSRFVTVTKLVIGGLTLSEVDAVVTAGSAGITGSVEIDGNIGNEILRSYKVVFDYRNLLLYLLPMRP